MNRKNAETHGNSPKNNQKISGMSETLLLYIILFFGATILALWGFQSFLLDDFYRAEKEKDAVNACAELMTVPEGDADGVKRIAEKYGVCITAYVMGSNGSAETIMDKHVLSHCTVHNTNNRSKYTIYEAAKERGGLFLQYFSYLPEKGVFESISDDEAANTTEVNMIYARVFFGTEEGKDTLVILDTIITPVTATVRTVRFQLGVFTAFFVVSAVIFAYILSKKFTSPIKRLTKAAEGFGSADGFSPKLGSNEYREIIELSDTLAYASAELEKTEQLRRELVANVSHDLRTPLTTIIGYGEMMRDLPGESTPENAANIVREAERLNRLVSDMFTLSRIQSGTAPLKNERFSLTEVIGTTVGNYSEMLSHEGFKITFESSGDAIVEGDAVMIGQVVQNFLLNAVNHSGSVKDITVSQIISGGWVTVAVRDRGEGIPADRLADIWERYRKVNSAHARTEGSGLGLSIVKAIMEQVGGHYGVDSAVGEGSTFWFALKTAE